MSTLFRIAVDVPKEMLLKSNGDRDHWTALSSKAKALKLLGKVHGRNLGLDMPVHERVDLLVQVSYPKRPAKADAPNLYPTVKHLEDGLVLAGVLTDDSYQYIRRHIFEVGEPTGRPGTWQIVLSGHTIKEE